MSAPVYVADTAKWAEKYDIRYVRARRGDVVHRVECSRKGVVYPWIYAARHLDNDHSRVLFALAKSDLHACSYCMESRAPEDDPR